MSARSGGDDDDDDYFTSDSLAESQRCLRTACASMRRRDTTPASARECADFRAYYFCRSEHSANQAASCSATSCGTVAVSGFTVAASCRLAHHF